MMNIEKKLSVSMIAVALCVSFASAAGQDQPSGGLAPIDESQFTDTSSSSQTGQPGAVDENGVAEISNAIIEGIQISGEPGDRPDEKVISCYFIFRDKPSSYFYEVKIKDKKIIFEFNDTKSSATPIPSVAETPITGFTIEQKMFDINKDIKGLRPEFHNLIRVVFNVSMVPKISVSDEYNVISFSYRWTTDSTKLPSYVLTPTSPWPWYAGGSAGLIGAYTYFAWKNHWPPFPKPKPIVEGPLDITDLPTRPNRN